MSGTEGMRRRQINRMRQAEREAARPASAPVPRAERTITQLREEAGLSVDELAARLGVKPGAVALVERTEASRARIRAYLT